MSSKHICKSKCIERIKPLRPFPIILNNNGSDKIDTELSAICIEVRTLLLINTEFIPNERKSIQTNACNNKELQNKMSGGVRVKSTLTMEWLKNFTYIEVKMGKTNA